MGRRSIRRETLEDILHCIGEGVILQEADGRISFLNHTAQRIFETDEERALGRTSFDSEWRLIHEDGSPCPGPEHPSMITLRTGRTLNNRILGIARPGRPVTWISINTCPVISPGGESPEAVVITFSDITVRKRAEEEFERFFDLTPDLACIASTSGYFLKLNPAWPATLGFSENELMATSFFDFIHPDDREATMAEVERQSAGGDTMGFVNRYRCKDGSYKWLEWKATPGVGNDLLYASARDITERKRAEKELGLHSLVLGQIHDLVTVTDLEGYVTYINDAGCRMLGRTRDELIGRHIETFGQDPDGGATQSEILRQTLAAGRWRGQVVNVSSGGDQIILDCRTQVVTDASGRPIALCGISTDITGQKQTEEALVEQKRYLNAILQATADAFWVLDRKGRFTEVNRACCEMTGYTRKELLGRRVSSLNAVESREDMEARIDRILAKGSEVFETIHRRNDGTTYPVEISAAYLGVGGGWFVCFARDLSERKRNEERIALLGRMLDEAPAAITIHDTAGCFLFANRKALTLHGYRDLDEFLKLKLQDLDMPESKALIDERMLKIDRDGEAAFEVAHRRSDGSAFPMAVTAKKITWQGRSALLSIASDITERRQAEQEQARLQAQLAQVQKMDALGTLSSGIAHDFNNILAAILGYSELAQEELGRENEPVLDDLAEITRAALKAKGLVRQILSFSRVAEGQRRLLSLGRAAREARVILERTLPKMVDLRIDLRGDLWTVNADPQQVEQALINLAANAADAIEGKGLVAIGARNLEPGTARCRVCGEILNGPHVMLTVEDDGKGMSPEVLAKIFEPFFTTKGIGKGTGLGLFSVYGIVTGHGGHICCRSGEGKGSKFFIYLPADPKAKPDPEPENDDDREETGGRATILVVDDEPAVRDIAEKMLTRSGYKVMQAADGEEALATHARHGDEIDLVLLDLGMPGMGGKACLSELRRLHPGAKVVIASGYIQYELTDELQKLGAAGMVSKPYRKADLLQAVKDAIG